MRAKDRFLLAACVAVLALASALGPTIQAYFGYGARGGRIASTTALAAGDAAAGNAALTDAGVQEAYEEALQIVGASYAGDYAVDAVNKHAIQGMLRTLDPHSTFFDSREFSELRNEQQSQFYGIGVTINRRNGRIYVLAAIPGTPAEKAGLRYGDAIVAVDGKSAADWTPDQILENVRGELGKPVEITVERVGVPKPITVSITRASVPLPTVRNSFMLNPSVGYVALTGGFSSTTDQELARAIADLKGHGMEQLVLDMRRNPGGLLDEAIKVAQRFLPAGQKILVVRGRGGGQRGEVVYTSKNENPETMPLVILIDRGTASAAEVVTGGLQDHDRALVVGETSFGKGLVQTVFQLNFNTGLTLTTSKYYTPTGRSIQRDYSQISFYDYYMHRNNADLDAEPPRGEPLLTDSGREVYGGDGIAPDIRIPALESSPTRVRLFNATFEFARQLVAGQVEGLREYRVEEVDYDYELRGDEYRITDKVLEAFRRYLSEHPDLGATTAQANENLDFVRNRIREEVITAAYGTDAGNRIFILNDPQAQGAIEALPQARQLAENLRARADRN
jgi:carboxyl-terminal processing protease